MIEKNDIMIILRLLVFNNYQFDALNRPEFVELFNLPKFKNAVGNMCPKTHEFFKPFQLSLILNLPGMNVASHLDIPYFYGATRYQFPQWLLLVMQHSGLFKKRRLPQVKYYIYIIYQLLIIHIYTINIIGTSISICT